MCTSEIANVLKRAIERRLEINRKTDFDKECVTHSYYREEFCTIQLNFGRQAGHTTAISQLSRPEDVIIVYTEAMRHYWKSQFPWQYSIVETKGFKHEYENSSKTPRIIWIDNASLFKDKDLEIVKDFYFKNKNQLIVQLG